MVLKTALRDLKNALEELHPVGVRLEYVPLLEADADSEVGTADALRQIRDRIEVWSAAVVFLFGCCCGKYKNNPFI